LDVRPRAVFLADYDLRLAERLVQGVDLWLNTPLPPWEACGTSGMKVLVNGGLNASSIDGWWAEAYRPEVGWALPHGCTDADDATSLYELLETEIVPAFFDRAPHGVPRSWIARVRASMATLTPKYSANRAVREYTERFYLPAATSYASRSADRGAVARRLVESIAHARARWPSLRFGQVHVKTEGGQHRFSVDAYLDDLDPDHVSIELYADAMRDGTPFRARMRREAPLVGSRGFVYATEVSDARPASDFTPRAAAAYDGARIPLELAMVTWAR
jgi:starch phosphorylase